MKLEDYLKRDAELFPDKIAVVCGSESVTYAALYQKVVACSDNLMKSYHSGQIVSIRSSQTIDFLVTYFALHKIGCVVAPLEKDTPDSLFKSISDKLSCYNTPEGIADVLYTTGTTGSPKGVMISHETIIADAENLIGGQCFCHDLVFVINGPLNHIGSLSKVYPIILLGATLVITDGLRDINAFFDAFNYPAKKFATFLVPASIRILIKFSAQRLSELADKIDFIETGAAAIAHEDMLTLCKLLPQSRLYNTYASTETGIISTYNFNDGKCLAGCLGMPMKHSVVTITEKGLIACKGGTLMSGYIGEPERTATILYNETLYTSDLGYIDDLGMLHLTGREDDVINVGGYKVAPTEVEDAALSYPIIKDCVCVSVVHPITGLALKLIVVVEENESFDKRELARFLKRKLESFKIPQFYEIASSIKRTNNGKIDRKYYKQ